MKAEWMINKMKGIGSFLFILFLSIQVFLLIPLAISLMVADSTFGNPLIAIGMFGFSTMLAIGITKVIISKSNETLVGVLYFLFTVAVCIFTNINNITTEIILFLDQYLTFF